MQFKSTKLTPLKPKEITTLLLLVVFLLSSCATLFKGTTQTVSYSSEPSGAKVYVNGQYMGTTPFQLNMKVDRTYTIEFRKEGYDNKIVVLNNSIGAGWIVLDVLGWGIPIIVDAATGAWYSLDQDHVNAVLEAQQKK